MNHYTNTSYPVSKGQLKLIGTMMQERGVTHERLFKIYPDRPQTSADAKAVINWLKTIPRADGKSATPSASPQSKLSYPHVTPGYYAATVPGENKLKFFRVKDPKNPTGNSGFQYVDQLSTDLKWPVKPGPRKAAILQEIAKDEALAGKTYAENINSCYNCNRTLTDMDNPYKPFGLGPDCGPKRMG